MMNAEQRGGSKDILFPVSVSKLAVMSICTLGFYDLYWMHANWVRIRNRSGLSLSPAMRTVFAVLFLYPLLQRMRVLSVEAGGRSFPSLFLVVGWAITVGACPFLPAPYSLLSMFGFVFLIPVQASVNQANAHFSPLHHRNSRLTVWNWLLVVPSSLLIGLTIIGAFIGKQ